MRETILTEVARCSNDIIDEDDQVTHEVVRFTQKVSSSIEQ
jgi:hypothetical protein